MRAKVERETERRSAELKREAQRLKQEFGKHEQVSPAQVEAVPAALRGVRVIRDGKVVAESVSAKREEVRPGRSGERDLRAPDRAIVKGDRVRLSTLGSIGVVDRIKDDEAEVRVGSLRMREKLTNLELIEDGRSSSPTVREGAGQGPLETMRRAATTTELHLHSREADSKFQTQTELNLIGKKTDEATEMTDKFLDEAFLKGLSEVRIIHGHGTGALRKAIAELLADHPHVARFAAAAQDKGGTGATVVELKI